MKQFLLVPVLALSLSAAPIRFWSGDNINEYNSATGANVILDPHPVWAVAPPAQWISSINSGTGGVVIPNNWTAPFASFYETFTLGSITASAHLSVWADDTAAIYINGFLLDAPAPSQGTACASDAVGCTQMMAGRYQLAPWLQSGLNTVRIDAYQRDGATAGVMYWGDYISSDGPPTPDDVPEPSTSALIGVGLVGLGVIARRRKL